MYVGAEVAADQRVQDRNGPDVLVLVHLPSAPIAHPDVAGAEGSAGAAVQVEPVQDVVLRAHRAGEVDVRVRVERMHAAQDVLPGLQLRQGPLAGPAVRADAAGPVVLPARRVPRKRVDARDERRCRDPAGVQQVQEVLRRVAADLAAQDVGHGELQVLQHLDDGLEHGGVLLDGPEVRREDRLVRQDLIAGIAASVGQAHRRGNAGDLLGEVHAAQERAHRRDACVRSVVGASPSAEHQRRRHADGVRGLAQRVPLGRAARRRARVDKQRREVGQDALLLQIEHVAVCPSEARDLHQHGPPPTAVLGRPGVVGGDDGPPHVHVGAEEDVGCKVHGTQAEVRLGRLELVEAGT
mmetsp:Transcript_96476/g.295119  ORF Transcript_96476/g.295119 Transcript_96476/m.295119 type:complete len:353 (+) Transcript_96476:512-1570(+)